MTDPPYSLLSHIGDLLGIGPGQTFTDPCFKVAHGITDDPQAHIDALVEAGVLERLGTWGAEPSGRHITAYGVVQPHVHDWRVIGPTQADSVSQVLVGCGCGNKHWVLNRLPIEVPDD